MKKFSAIQIVVVSSLATLALLGAQQAWAGNLTVDGSLTVSNDLTAQSITLGGETRSNWPSAGTAAVDLGHTPVLPEQAASYYSIVLTNHAVWDFGTHTTGHAFHLKIGQDSAGGHTNVWPPDMRWPGDTRPATTTQAGRWDVFQIVDDGSHWNGVVGGLNYRDPCVTNCPYALEFDGSQNYVEASIGTWNLASSYTVEGWIKTTSVNTWAYAPICTTCGDDYGGACFSLNIHDQGDVDFIDSRIGEISYAINYHDGEWHHLAGVVDGNSMRLYFDGEEVASTTGSTNSFANSAPARIGWQNTHGGVFLQGVVDEVRVSSIARYSGNFTPAPSFTTDSDTVAYWKFNEGEGSVAVDETGNHDGTLEGSPQPQWVEGR